MLIENLIANPIFVLNAIQLDDCHIIFLCRIHPPPFAAPLRLRVRNLPDPDHTRRGIRLAPDHRTFLVCSLVRQGSASRTLKAPHTRIVYPLENLDLNLYVLCVHPT